jgi:hypothetical protein
MGGTSANTGSACYSDFSNTSLSFSARIFTFTPAVNPSFSYSAGTGKTGRAFVINGPCLAGPKTSGGEA